MIAIRSYAQHLYWSSKILKSYYCLKFDFEVYTISHFPIEQRTGSSRLFGGQKKTICQIWRLGSFPTLLKLFVQPEMQQL
jgi:hypothetical protein